jgi:uncharacterized cupredoxin-like copper-binding protein
MAAAPALRAPQPLLPRSPYGTTSEPTAGQTIDAVRRAVKQALSHGQAWQSPGAVPSGRRYGRCRVHQRALGISPRRPTTTKEQHMRRSVLALATAGPTASSATVVNVKLTEMKILPSTTSVKAGKVTFKVKNAGMALHEVVVIRSNVAPGKLPVKNHQASEAGSIGEVSDLHAGKSGTLTVTMKPGKYILICNLTGHYEAGMYTGFTVK